MVDLVIYLLSTFYIFFLLIFFSWKTFLLYTIIVLTNLIYQNAAGFHLRDAQQWCSNAIMPSQNSVTSRSAKCASTSTSIHQMKIFSQQEIFLSGRETIRNLNQSIIRLFLLRTLHLCGGVHYPDTVSLSFFTNPDFLLW